MDVDDGNDPVLRNVLDHETVFGYRSFELWQGDITTPKNDVDMIVISYGVIAGLGQVGYAVEDRHDIDIDDIRQNNCEFDFSNDLGIWVSGLLPDHLPFRRIMVVILQDLDPLHCQSSEVNMKRAFNSIFCCLAILEVKMEMHSETDVPTVRSVSLPIIGSGNMEWDIDEILLMLIPEAKKALERRRYLQKILLYGYDEYQCTLLDRSMNKILNRIELSSVGSDNGSGSTNSRPTNPSIDIRLLCDDIVNQLVQIRPHFLYSGHLQLIQDAEAVLQRNEVRFFEVAIIGRRLAETVTKMFHGGHLPTRILSQNIQKLSSVVGGTTTLSIPPWLITYLHVLRCLGDESAHEKVDGSIGRNKQLLSPSSFYRLSISETTDDSNNIVNSDMKTKISSNNSASSSSTKPSFDGKKHSEG